MISQMVFDGIMRADENTLAGRIQAKACGGARKLLLKVADPLITFSNGTMKMVLPLSHNLPVYLKKYPEYSLNVGRIARILHDEKYPDLNVIDIGANVGDTAVIVKNAIDCPLLCIEGNDTYVKVWKLNAAPLRDVCLEKSYIGEKSETVGMISREVNGTAHLENDGRSTITVKTLSEVLVKYPQFAASKLIKIDTDGFDGKIIKGSVRHLATAKPVIFFEYHPYFWAQQGDNAISVISALRDIGYRKALIYDNIGRYLETVRMDDRTLWEDLTDYFSGCEERYCDVCVFHGDDDGLAEIVREKERAHFGGTKNPGT